MLESIYYCSGIVVAICAVIALIQIIISKHQLESERKNQKNQLVREAQKFAIEQIAYFNNTIIPLENTIFKKRNGNKISIFDNSDISIEGKTIKIKANFSKEDRDKIIDIAEEVTNVINSLEIYSTVIISGLANEDFAYQIQGYTYCKIVEQYLVFIIDDSNNKTKKSSTLKLYTLWKSRLNKEKLISEKEKLERSLANTSDRTITIIGTDE